MNHSRTTLRSILRVSARSFLRSGPAISEVGLLLVLVTAGSAQVVSTLYSFTG